MASGCSFCRLFQLLGGLSLGIGLFILLAEDEVMDVLSRVPAAGEKLESALSTTSCLIYANAVSTQKPLSELDYLVISKS